MKQSDHAKNIHFSSKSKSLFCLACILFSSPYGNIKVSSNWTKDGYKSWNNYTEIKGKKGIANHLRSSGHLDSDLRTHGFIEAETSKSRHFKILFFMFSLLMFQLSKLVRKFKGKDSSQIINYYYCEHHNISIFFSSSSIL